MFGIEFLIEGQWTKLLNARSACLVAFETREDAEDTILLHWGKSVIDNGVIRAVDLSFRRESHA